MLELETSAHHPGSAPVDQQQLYLLLHGALDARGWANPHEQPGGLQAGEMNAWWRCTAVAARGAGAQLSVRVRYSGYEEAADEEWRAMCDLRRGGAAEAGLRSGAFASMRRRVGEAIEVAAIPTNGLTYYFIAHLLTNHSWLLSDSQPLITNGSQRMVARHLPPTILPLARSPPSPPTATRRPYGRRLSWRSRRRPQADA